MAKPKLGHCHRHWSSNMPRSSDTPQAQKSTWRRKELASCTRDSYRCEWNVSMVHELPEQEVALTKEKQFQTVAYSGGKHTLRPYTTINVSLHAAHIFNPASIRLNKVCWKPQHCPGTNKPARTGQILRPLLHKGWTRRRYSSTAPVKTPDRSYCTHDVWCMFIVENCYMATSYILDIKWVALWIDLLRLCSKLDHCG